MTEQTSLWTPAALAALLMLGGLAAAAPARAAKSPPQLAPDEGYELVRTLVEGERGERKRAAKRLVKAGDPSMVPALVDAIFFAPADAREQVLEVLRELAGEDPGTGYYDWVELVGRRRDLTPKDGYLEWKVSQLAKIDPTYHKILYPGVPTRLRLEEIVWGGAGVGKIPALDDPPRVEASAADKLHDDEEVFGVSFGGEHHAYPLRYVSWHELVNDVVGGQAFVLSL